MILTLLLNFRMIWMIFIKTFKNAIQIKKENYRSFLLICFELFIRGRKLNTSLVFITQFYFTVPKNIRLNSTYYFIMKSQNNFNKFHLISYQILIFKTL